MNPTSHPAARRDWTGLLTSAQRLRITMAACRVRFAWPGVEKALTPEQTARAARHFEATPQSLRATKRLIDIHHPAFRAVTSIRGEIESYWRGLTLPFPETGVRLIPLDEVEAFDRQMCSYRMRLREAATDLDRSYDHLRVEAVRQLGSLFDPADYPATWQDLFACRWDFPNLDPPSNLRWLSPAVHQQEEFRVEALFEQAVRLAERTFYGSFTRLVGHLAERLAVEPDGDTPKVFRGSSVDNLIGFLAAYRRFDLRPDDRLDELIDLVELTLKGVTPERLRDFPGLRRTVAARLSWTHASLTAMAEVPHEGEDRPDAADSGGDDD
jgi:hypothetical protein